MKNKQFLLLILMIALSIHTLHAQSRKQKGLLKLAQQEYNNLRFAYAIPIFKQYIFEQKKDSTALLQLGNCYQKLNQYDSAIKYFELAVSVGVQYNSNMAEAYAITGQYDKATSIYKQLIDSNKTKLADARYFGFMNIKKMLNDSLDFSIFNTKLNTKWNEFNGVLYDSGLVYESNQFVNLVSRKKFFLFKLFKSKRSTFIPEFAWDGGGYSQLYFYSNLDSIRTDLMPTVDWNEKKPLKNYTDYSSNTPNDTKKIIGTYGVKTTDSLTNNTIQKFDVFARDKMNLGAVSFTADGKKAYYTRNQKKSLNVYQLEIWEASKIEGKWVNAKRMFFNNPKFSYFHPAITPDGKRLYYVTDDNTGEGGTDIFYVERNEDGSWKNTVNLGQDINTAGNELFPTFYEGNLFLSSNGHPGIGGLDIYRLVRGVNGEPILKNMGYPVNSAKDDFAFSIKGTKGFFSTNRNGSDDILAFDFKQSFVKLVGKLLIDNTIQVDKKVYLYQNNEQGKSILKDSTIVDAYGNYEFKIRPNQAYDLVTLDDEGNRFLQTITSDGYQKQDNDFIKNIAVINIPLSDKVKQAKVAAAEALRKAELAVQTTKFIRAIDSLKLLTKDYVELHHPFDQVYIIEKDLPNYYKVIELVKRIKNKKIVIVSAADCNGSLEYNEDLSNRRANRIYRTLSKLSDNEVVIKQVGERELLKDCTEARKDIDAQVVNRYSYIFIIDKK
jgi:tetratricopeptide (TPR) repeat protein/outer membrane protein OmpA-like peptidoglycan-associated protein